jgi:hypothetical protein
MTRLAAALIVIATVGTFAVCFFLGLVLPVGEHGYVYWAIRGPLWGLGVVALLLGTVATWLALRADSA